MNDPNVVEIPATGNRAGMSFGSTDERVFMAAMNLLFSADDDRQSFAATQRRRTFGGRRDLMQVLGYSTNPTYADFWSRYQRQDIASRVIDLPVDQTWGGGEIAIEEWPEWKQFNRRLEVQSRMTELDRLASIGDYAAILIGVREDQESVDEQATEKALLQPVVKLNSLEDILYLQQYPRDAVEIDETDNNPMSPRFGKPEIYKITITTQVQTSSGSSSSAGTNASKKTFLRVHHSRVLHVTPNRILSDVTGFSRLMPILDRLEDLDKVVGGSAEMFWLGADRSLVLSQQSAGNSTGGTALGSNNTKTDLRTQAEEMAHGLRRVLLLTNGEAKTLEPNAPDPSGIVQALLQLIAAASGIPIRILVGSERGEQASTQDRSNFADGIANRRSNYAQPQILKAFIQRLFEWSVAPDPSTLTYQWPPIEVLSAEEKSQVDQRKVEAMKRGEEAVALGGAVFSAEDYRATLGFEGDAPGSAIAGTQNIDVDEDDPEVERQFRQRPPVN